MEILERVSQRRQKLARNDKDSSKRTGIVGATSKDHLEEGECGSFMELKTRKSRNGWKGYNLLTYKPVIFAANVTEDDLANDGADNAGVQRSRAYAEKEHCEVFVVCAQIEQEISELDDDEKKDVFGRSWIQRVWSGKTDSCKLSSPWTFKLT